MFNNFKKGGCIKGRMRKEEFDEKLIECETFRES